MAEPPEPETLERLRGCLASPFTDVVLHGLEVAAGRHDPTLALWVMPCLESPQAVVRRRAARVLGQLGAPGAAEALVLRLEDEDPGVALEAAWALEQVRPTDEVVTARRVRTTQELAEPQAPEAALASPPSFEAAPAPPPGPAAPPGPAPVLPPRPPPSSRPPEPAPPGPGPGSVGMATGAELAQLLATLEENAERRADRAGSPRFELLLVFVFLGFVFGRYLPGDREEAGPLPPPAGRMTRTRARALLFPGDGVLARLGRGASLVLEDDSRGVPLLDEAVTEYHFAPREQREAGGDEHFRLELESERNPLGPPRTWRPNAESAPGAARTPEGAASRPEVPAWAREPGPDVEAPPPVAEATPRSEPGSLPSMVSKAEESLYKAAARRYLEAGDRDHAIELLETLTGRNFPGDELERYLSQP
jgi:hypothetical protein